MYITCWSTKTPFYHAKHQHNSCGGTFIFYYRECCGSGSGYETFSRIWIRKQIRKKSFRIRNEFEVELLCKLIKFYSFSTKCSIKCLNSFFIKKFPKKLMSLYNMQPNTLTRREYKGKIYVLNIETIQVGSEKNISGSTTLLTGIGVEVF